MASKNNSEGGPQQPRTPKQILLSYFYWTYRRGSFHYDIMVTLILLFIFITPQFWNYGDHQSLATPMHPIQVSGQGRGLILTVQAADVDVPAGASDRQVRQILRKAIEPVTGDSVAVERWETVIDAQGNLAWKIWAHR
jgi:hypothetical protein